MLTHDNLPSSYLMARVSRIVGLAIILGCLQSCGVFVTAAGAVNPNKDTPPALDDMALVLTDQFATMALFSQVAYRRDGSDPKNPPCDYVKSPRSDPWGNLSSDRYGLPSTDESGQWARWIGPSQIGCVAIGGLYAETFVHLNNLSVIDEAVIAFRGTEVTSALDWLSNIYAALGIEPRQYKASRRIVRTIVRALKIQNSDMKIYATGHSLGGGLAQQAGYLTKDIRAVYAFNSTPVTNWSYLTLTKPHSSEGDKMTYLEAMAQGASVGNAYPTIYRVSNGGEALSPLRAVASAFTSSRYGRYDFTVQFDRKRPIRGHAMSVIACRFLTIVQSDAFRSYKNANGPDDNPFAKHSLDAKSAKRIMPTLCRNQPTDPIHDSDPHTAPTHATPASLRTITVASEGLQH